MGSSRVCYSERCVALQWRYMPIFTTLSATFTNIPSILSSLFEIIGNCSRLVIHTVYLVKASSFGGLLCNLTQLGVRSIGATVNTGGDNLSCRIYGNSYHNTPLGLRCADRTRKPFTLYATTIEIKSSLNTDACLLRLCRLIVGHHITEFAPWRYGLVAIDVAIRHM